MTINEWLNARRLGESYWLYMLRMANSGYRLEHVAREVRAVSHIEVPAEAIYQDDDAN